VRDGDPDPDIEFSLVDKQRPLDVLLNDEGLRADSRLVVAYCWALQLRDDLASRVCGLVLLDHH
jgi:hypothetical protein